MAEFSILSEVRRGFSKTATLIILRVDFELFRTLVGKIPWESVLKCKGVQEGWLFLKKEVLNAQEQAVPLCQKMSQQGRRPVWLNRELLLRHWEKKRVEEGPCNSHRVQGMCRHLCRENLRKAKAQHELNLVSCFFIFSLYIQKHPIVLYFTWYLNFQFIMLISNRASSGLRM